MNPDLVLEDDELPSYEDLSEEQDEIYNLPLDGNFLVSGPPGTGKSVMALYRAQALTIDDRSPSILMFNNVLKQYTRRHAAHLGVEDNVETFHRWMRQFWLGTYRHNPPKLGGDDWAYDWKTIASQFMSDPPQPHTLHDLIVDEGQDMPSDFYRIVRWVSANITVFADENQQLRDDNTTLREIKANVGAVDHLHLCRNYRNSLEIAKLAGWFYCGAPTGVPDLPSRSWRPGPTVQNYASLNEFVEAVARYATTHTNRRIGIAAPTKAAQKKLYNRLSHRQVPTETYIWDDDKHRVLDFSARNVKIINYMSLKGLQFDTLFVPDLQLVTGDVTSATIRMRFYVVTSRARNELYLSYTGDTEPPLVARIPHDLLTRV
ncbi:AAA family ATPase [Actinoplanes sp. KI2]|uniref:AAA family ATPase n=1 Tax=Actinoplanes sp. KI2 TaxID=2983315 RepID=UPI0021D5D443|nr:AAA family ATPase [Actinoplanes sp. KI2]MCU7730916.1 AAA family ATPase [Actinoplanes sp. KI2]